MKNYLSLIFLFFMQLTWAQIGINTINPNKHSILHISEGANPTQLKGVIIPRLSKIQMDSITYSDPLTKLSLRLNDTDHGLYLFDLESKCFSYWDKVHNDWQKVCETNRLAKVNIPCNLVKIYGKYEVNKSLNSSNYIVAQVNVNKIGYYYLTFKSNNGYSFYANGYFPKTGTFEITLRGEGIPINANTTNLDLVINNETPITSCINLTTNAGEINGQIPDNNIKPAIANYVLYCDDIQILGTYTTGVVLNTSNKIRLKLFVAKPGSYVIESNIVGGMQFRATGDFTTTGEKIIDLQGTGIPTNVRDALFTLISNSLSDFKYLCDAKVKIDINIIDKKVLIVQNTPLSFTTNWLAYNLLKNGVNFGPSGTFKMGNINITTATTIPTDIITQKYDVVVLNGNITISEVDATQLKNYLNAKGILLSFVGNNTSNQNLLNSIFNTTITTANSDGVYSLEYVNDDILNGPFGYAANRFWGDNNSNSGTAVTGLPLDQITLYSNSITYNIIDAYNTQTQLRSSNSITGFRHNNLNFIWFGSRDFNGDRMTSTYSSEGFDNNTNPFHLNSSGKPEYKAQYSGTTNIYYNKLDVYNSIITANAFAWAFTLAEYNGINTTP